ncbi:MAG: hypothetical protein J7L15_03580 [Clostridiales bacterium]|nr:hypothetical protein [Clostridiales bacterium]
MILHDIDKILIDDKEVTYMYLDEEIVYTFGFQETYDEKLLYNIDNIAVEFNE